jgi:hypothetical protein
MSFDIKCKYITVKHKFQGHVPAEFGGFTDTQTKSRIKNDVDFQPGVQNVQCHLFYGSDTSST